MLVDGFGELSSCAVFAHAFSKAFVLVAIAGCGADFRFDAVLPTVMDKEPLLRGEAEVAFVPFAIGLEEAEILAELSHQGGFLVGDGEVVGSPGVAGDLVFTEAGVAAGLGFHFEEGEILEAFFVKPPGG